MKDIRSISSLQGRGIVCIIKVLRRASNSCVVSIVAYQDYQDQWMDMQKEEIVFSHMWDWERMRTIIIVQEVKVHGWLSWIKELYFAALFWFL